MVSPWILGLSEDDLLRFFRRYPADQLFDVELFGADAVQRRNDAAQYMVHAVILLGAFDGDHVPDIFDHAYGIVTAHAVAADIAEFVIGDVKTLLQNLISLRMGSYGLREFCHHVGVLFDQVQHQSQGGLLPIPGSLANSFTAFSNKLEEKIMA